MASSTDLQSNYKFKLGNNRLGLWLFLFSDMFIFGGLLVTRAVLLGYTRPDLNQTLGFIVTLILLMSSFFMNRAETHMAHGNQKSFSRNLLVTIILGVIFVLGVVGVEWPLAPFGPGDGAVGAVFYILTSFHALHVLSGVILLVIVYRNSSKGLYSAEKHWPVEAGAIYWHFVDLVWFFIYPALYLIGTPV
ncbi:MAG: heme-copper oxidase subunit III [Chloroflexi bacterium]|nr:heme-copper oxidase subunit III [Chloroflexota bacterium]